MNLRPRRGGGGTARASPYSALALHWFRCAIASCTSPTALRSGLFNQERPWNARPPLCPEFVELVTAAHRLIRIALRSATEASRVHTSPRARRKASQHSRMREQPVGTPRPLTLVLHPLSLTPQLLSAVAQWRIHQSSPTDAAARLTATHGEPAFATGDVTVAESRTRWPGSGNLLIVAGKYPLPGGAIYVPHGGSDCSGTGSHLSSSGSPTV